MTLPDASKLVCLETCPDGTFDDGSGVCRLTNPCDAGNACGENAKCVSEIEGEKECVCVTGYYMSDGSCKALSACSAADEWESTPPTATSDRKCSKATVCSSSEFESKPLTKAEDRECSKLTLCAADEFISIAATEVSDRVCSEVTECASAQFESKAPTETSDRMCSAITECTQGEYEAQAPQKIKTGYVPQLRNAKEE